MNNAVDLDNAVVMSGSAGLLDLPDEILKYILSPASIGRFGCTMMLHVCKQTAAIVSTSVRGNALQMFISDEIPNDNLHDWANSKGYLIFYAKTYNLLFINTDRPYW
jgi:hypothetical protein